MIDNEIVNNVNEDNGAVDKTTSPTPKQPKVATKVEPKKDELVSVLFVKAVTCDNKAYKIHDIAEILQSSLDKLPEKSYLVRNVKKK